MALIKCPECGNEISDEAKACIHCGYILHKNESIIDKVKKIGKKKLIGIGVIAAVVVLCVVCFGMFAGGPVEFQAAKYIRETKKIDDVKEINAVVCISKKYYGQDENTLGYVVLYNSKDDSEFAYFEKGVYKGNGYNGGDASSSEDITFYNMHALSAISKALEFINEEGLVETTCKKHYKADEGVIYIDLIDIEKWIENK